MIVGDLPALITQRLGLGMEPNVANLADALFSAAASASGIVAYSDDTSRRTAYRDLLSAADGVCANLATLGIKPGERVILTCSIDPAFPALYCGVLLRGAVPCILAQPGNTQDEPSIRRIASVAERVGASLIIAPPTSPGLPMSIAAATPTELINTGAPPFLAHTIRSPDDLAIIQATSGSTADPKCVALTHRQVLSNLEQLRRAISCRREDVISSWLPLYHDMGLIGGFLLPIYTASDLVQLSPRQFIRRPASWLRAISVHRAAFSPAPNFAYRYATERVLDGELEGVDLSRWRVAICGSEPIDPAVLAAFEQRFAKWGFRSGVLAPAYGLAEASLCVTMHEAGQPLQSEELSIPGLARGATRRGGAGEATTTVCDCGVPMEGTVLRIVDGLGREVDDGLVGRILVASPSTMAGYIGADGELHRTRSDGWLDTGDLGYVRQKHLFVTGRAKDLIIIRGQKYAPSDFERAAAEVPLVDPQRVVAVQHDAVGRGALIIICERPRGRVGEDGKLAEEIARHVAVRTGIRPDQVAIVDRNRVERTTSGKPRRRATLDRAIEEGQIANG